MGTILRLLVGLAVALAALALLFRLGGTMSVEDRGREGTLYVVEMRDFYFDPAGLFLREGDRVLWVLVEDRLGDGHSATAYHPAHDKRLRVPEGAEPWTSPLLKEPGRSYERAFTVRGVHDYFCIPHEDVGMVGRLIVEEATGPGAEPTDAGISPAGRSSLPSAEELLGPAGLFFNLQGRVNAVAFFALWRGDWDRALGTLDALVRELEADRENPEGVLAQLEGLGLLPEVQEGFRTLREALRARDPQAVAERKEALKAVLDEAIQALAARPPGSESG